MVPCYIHRCFFIHREFSSSVEDTTAGTRRTIDLKKSDSDLNWLPALAAYWRGVTSDDLVIKIIEVHFNDFLVLCKVELVQVGSLLCNFQWLPWWAFRCSNLDCCYLSRRCGCCLGSGRTMSSAVWAWVSETRQERWISCRLFSIDANNIFFAYLLWLMWALTTTHIILIFILILIYFNYF